MPPIVISEEKPKREGNGELSLPVKEEADQPPLDKKTKLLISLLFGIGCLTCITMILLFSVHRYKKKDEGSYEVHGSYYTPGKQF